MCSTAIPQFTCAEIRLLYFNFLHCVTVFATLAAFQTINSAVDLKGILHITVNDLIIHFLFSYTLWGITSRPDNLLAFVLLISSKSIFCPFSLKISPTTSWKQKGLKVVEMNVRNYAGKLMAEGVNL